MRALFPICVLAVAVVAVGGCADSEPERTELTLTVAAPDNRDTARTATLRCATGAGGDHPAADRACAELDAVDGDFDALNVDPGVICTQEYDPVVYAASGTWRGRAVAFTKTFPNDCHGKGATGSVFDF
ncbi:subtilase-type protease inhibitor [Nocardia sp. CC227C]|uniref:subtilase-type protease inhibitor n=1 Tax=Nocardia sp. CC227C TaxID=3044562 RepID=UPI00278C72DB|nr:subtilase-type protease inhibitor [Nocardia sp. CC227C]